MGGVHRPKEEEEEENGRKPAPVVLLRLFGVDVVADEEPDDNDIGLRKSSSMPNLANPLLPHGEAGERKGYASDDLELASRHQKRRRRKAQERKKGDFFFSFPLSPPPGFDCFVLAEVVRYNPRTDSRTKNVVLDSEIKKTSPVMCESTPALTIHKALAPQILKYYQ